jgi:hypothetical protein
MTLTGSYPGPEVWFEEMSCNQRLLEFSSPRTPFLESLTVAEHLNPLPTTLTCMLGQVRAPSLDNLGERRLPS